MYCTLQCIVLDSQAGSLPPITEKYRECVSPAFKVVEVEALLAYLMRRLGRAECGRRVARALLRERMTHRKDQGTRLRVATCGDRLERNKPSKRVLK